MNRFYIGIVCFVVQWIFFFVYYLKGGLSIEKTNIVFAVFNLVAFGVLTPATLLAIVHKVNVPQGIAWMASIPLIFCCFVVPPFWPLLAYSLIWIFDAKAVFKKDADSVFPYLGVMMVFFIAWILGNHIAHDKLIYMKYLISIFYVAIAFTIRISSDNAEIRKAMAVVLFLALGSTVVAAFDLLLAYMGT